MSKPLPVKSVRFEARITPEQKALFQYAATLTGQTLSEFAATCLKEAATRVVYENEILKLSAKDSMAFAEAVLGSSEPNDALKRAAKKYQETMGED